jgi:hypothetical protein
MKCSKRKKPFTAPQTAAILRLYVQQRLPTPETAKRLRLSLDHVVQFLRERGVLRRQGPTTPRKISLAARHKLESELPTTTDADLGRKYGLTRERVRQIRQKLGYPSSQFIRVERIRRAQAERREQKERARELRERQRRAKRLPAVNHLSERWKSGATVAELAREYGFTCVTVRNRISWLRMRFPNKFPDRRSRRLLKTDS